MRSFTGQEGGHCLARPRKPAHDCADRYALNVGRLLVGISLHKHQDGEGVVGVTAIDLDRRVYRRAGRGDHVDFSAPGVRVRAAAARGGYASMSGTSFATPVVAALVALQIAGRDPDADSKLSRITRSVLDLGDPGKDEIYGHGLLVIERE